MVPGVKEDAGTVFKPEGKDGLLLPERIINRLDFVLSVMYTIDRETGIIPLEAELARAVEANADNQSGEQTGEGKAVLRLGFLVLKRLKIHSYWRVGLLYRTIELNRGSIGITNEAVVAEPESETKHQQGYKEVTMGIFFIKRKFHSAYYTKLFR